MIRTHDVVALSYRAMLLSALIAPVRASGAQPALGGLGRCAEPLLSGAAAKGAAAPVHPERLRETFAPAIVARDWPTVINGYSGTVESTLKAIASSSPAFIMVRDSILGDQKHARKDMLTWIVRPLPSRDSVMSGDVVNQFRPVLVPGGRLAVLQESFRPFGIVVDTTTMSTAEVEAICWSSWSLYRLAGMVNYESVPAALARVEAQTRRWERYQSKGPLQLPHELVLNRLLRRLKGSAARTQFEPPRWDAVLVHPFAGVEFRRAGDGVARTETVALEALGGTVWFADWNRFVGASFVLSSTSGGELGYGGLLRFGGLATAGYVQRRASAGATSRVLLVQLDALRLLANDSNAKRALGLFGVSGEALYGKKQ